MKYTPLIRAFLPLVLSMSDDMIWGNLHGFVFFDIFVLRNENRYIITVENCQKLMNRNGQKFKILLFILGMI